MSYILDALKKSEKQRQQDADTPRIHMPLPVPPKPVQEGIGYKWWLLAPCALIALGVIGYSIHSLISSSDSTPTVSQQAAPETKQQDQPAVAAISIPELQPSGKKVAFEENSSFNSPAQEPDLKSEGQPLPAAVQEETPDTAIPLLGELKPAVRESIPVFKLSGHVYSPAPELRMILINNSVVRENDVVEKGYVLEEITINGIILRKGEMRFQMIVQ